MYLTMKKEQFSIAYVKAMAALLGYNPTIYAVDNESVDIAFKATGYENAHFCDPQLNFQLKCTHKTFASDGHLHFQLMKKNYNDLCGKNKVSPKYLVVVCTPQLPDDWIQVDPEEMILRHSAYWFSLRNETPLSKQDSKVVLIPKANKFDIQKFEHLMDLASQDQAL